MTTTTSLPLLTISMSHATPAHASAATLQFLFPDLPHLLGTGYPDERPHVKYDYYGGSIEAWHYPNGSHQADTGVYWISEDEIIGPWCAHGNPASTDNPFPGVPYGDLQNHDY